MYRGAWRVAAHGIAQSRTRLKQLSRPHAGGTRDPCNWNVALFWLPNTSLEGSYCKAQKCLIRLVREEPGAAYRREARSARGPLRTEAAEPAGSGLSPACDCDDDGQAQSPVSGHKGS